MAEVTSANPIPVALALLDQRWPATPALADAMATLEALTATTPWPAPWALSVTFRPWMSFRVQVAKRPREFGIFSP
jgi:hypothetical protein